MIFINCIGYVAQFEPQRVPCPVGHNLIHINIEEFRLVDCTYFPMGHMKVIDFRSFSEIKITLESSDRSDQNVSSVCLLLQKFLFQK